MSKINADAEHPLSRRRFLGFLVGAAGSLWLLLTGCARDDEGSGAATPATDNAEIAEGPTDIPSPTPDEPTPTETPSPTPEPPATPVPGVRDLAMPQVRDILAMTANLSVQVNGEDEGEVVDSSGQVVHQNFCLDLETRIEEDDVLAFVPLLIVMHWDNIPRDIENPTTDGTVRGLGAGKSVQFCIDSRAHDEGGVTQSARIPIDASGQIMAHNADHVLAVVSNENIMTYLGQWEAACEGGDFLLPELYDLAHNEWETPGNDVSVGIESTGDYYTYVDMPADRQTANMLATVVMLMKTYGIPLQYVVGHHDIQAGKPDVGDEYASLMRLLVLLYALDREDAALLDLIPISRDNDPRVAISYYFGGPFGLFTQMRLGDEGVTALLELAFCNYGIAFCG